MSSNAQGVARGWDVRFSLLNYPMARYRSGLNIILMPDNGPRRSYRLSQRSFRLLCALFFLFLPICAIFLGAMAFHFWKESRFLVSGIQKFEEDCMAARATAERLEMLEKLLREESVPAREFILRRLAARQQPAHAAPENADEPVQAAMLPEGPGHEDFPVMESGDLKVSNVQAILRDNKLRISLDLANAQAQKVLTGEVTASLALADGRKVKLDFAPPDVGRFRINRFKRSVMNAILQRQLNLVNAQVIIEVADQDGRLIYRNVFPILQ